MHYIEATLTVSRVRDERPVSAKALINRGLGVKGSLQELMTRMQTKLPKVKVSCLFGGQAWVFTEFGEEKDIFVQIHPMDLTVEFHTL